MPMLTTALSQDLPRCKACGADLQCTDVDVQLTL